MQKIITKQEALTKGLKRYFTGIKCKYGHLSERYINGSCIVCDSIKSARYYKTPKGKKTRAVFFNNFSKTEKGKALNRKSSNEYYSTRKGKDYKKNYQRKRRSIDIPYKIRENISKRVKCPQTTNHLNIPSSVSVPLIVSPVNSKLLVHTSTLCSSNVFDH